jgi:nitrogen PTS system EIIA component
VGFSASNGMSNDVQKPIRNSLLAEAVIFDAAATTLTDAVLTAVPALGSATGLDTAVLRRLLVDAAMEADVAIGAGVAAPHAPVPELPRPAGAFIRLAEPIDIGALDGQAVDLVFATLFPKSDPRGHLIFLARLARLAQGRVFRDGLRQARSRGGGCAGRGGRGSAGWRARAPACPMRVPEPTPRWPLCLSLGKRRSTARFSS